MKTNMKSAAVSELKAKLSGYLMKVKQGEEVIVTDRGHPVAMLIPFRVHGIHAEDRERMALEGIIQLGKTGRIPPDLFKPSTVRDSKGLMLKSLLEEREEGY